jgi:hypothetical protein
MSEDDPAGSWVTSLALIALNDLPAATHQRLAGARWLVKCKGKEANWFWKWKFLTADRHVVFNPNKFGWPWIPDTVSWVVPTSFAILALRQMQCSCDSLIEIGVRIDCGIDMLIDRSCPAGGWNAGNGVVYGTELAAHPDDTAIALLALCNRTKDPVVLRSLYWLEDNASPASAPWSAGWKNLALAAYGRRVAPLISSALVIPELMRARDTSTLAIACLAAEPDRALASLGVGS